MLATAFISQSALKHNLEIARKNAPQSKIIAVIKADAYGHGVQNVIYALEKADMFAVSKLTEAREVRQLSNKPILILSGFHTQDNLKEIAHYQHHLVVHHISQSKYLFNFKQPLHIWLKIETGMHRLGLAKNDLKNLLEKSQKHPHIRIEALMSHLSSADEIKNTNKQNISLIQLKKLIQLAPKNLPKSLANSAAILDFKVAHLDYVRAGIMLYGISPFHNIHPDLKPVMTLSAPIIATKILAKGDKVGYGQTYSAPNKTHIAIIAIGYADGYPRSAQNGTPVLINSCLCSLIGRVSMDLICVDLKNTKASVGDEAVLWGKGLAAEIIAKHSNTIAYELLARIGRRVRYQISP